MSDDADVIKLYVVMSDDIQYNIGDYWLVGVYLTPEDAKQACDADRSARVEEYPIRLPHRPEVTP